LFVVLEVEVLSLPIKLGNGKGGNRSSLDIVRDVLSVASVSARKTRIMYQANLSFVQLEKYLGSLLEKGLLGYDGDSYYLTTKKGLEFLKLYDYYVEQVRLIREQENQRAKDRLSLENMFSSSRTSPKSNGVRNASHIIE
jgi:predicted transcriptional regulator